MEQSLPELQKALKGLVVMSGELEAVGKAIALNSVPESWEAKVKPPFYHRCEYRQQLHHLSSLLTHPWVSIDAN